MVDTMVESLLRADRGILSDSAKVAEKRQKSPRLRVLDAPGGGGCEQWSCYLDLAGAGAGVVEL